jgi:hypothetical protein
MARLLVALIAVSTVIGLGKHSASATRAAV